METTVERAVAPRGATVSGLLNMAGIKSRFDEVLGKRAPAFVSSVITAVNSNKSLKECDPMSVISSAMVAASLDLPINASLGFSHIVPYKKEAQFQMGWKGYIQLALRTGQYKTINLTQVLEGQIKKINRFTGDIEFNDEATSDKIIGYLLYFKLLNGYEKFVYWTTKECRDHGKKYSKSFAKGYGPWVDDFDAMAMKTVVKMGLSKFGVLSIEMQKAFEIDQSIVNQNGEVVEYPDSDSTSDETPVDSAPLVKDDLPEQKNTQVNDQVKSVKSLKNHAPQTKDEAIQKQNEAPAQIANEEKEVGNAFLEEVKQFNREGVGKEITQLALQLEIKGTANLTKKIQEKLPGKTLSQLSNDEMSGILDWFKIELAKKESTND